MKNWHSEKSPSLRRKSSMVMKKKYIVIEIHQGEENSFFDENSFLMKIICCDENYQPGQNFIVVMNYYHCDAN